MRWTAIAFAGFVVPLAGCHLAHTAAHNLVNEPIEYFDGKKVTRQLREEAEEVLKERERVHGREKVSDDYEDGFIDGYADFLEHGGNTAPPAVPPLKYRRGKFLNPDGHARVHEYFSGFQAGADAAACSGKRQFLTVPILLPDPVPPPPVNARQIPADQCAPTLPTRAGETLPAPRPQDETTGLPTPDRPYVPALPSAEPSVPLPVLSVPKVELPKAAEPVQLSTPMIDTPPPQIPAPRASVPLIAPPPTHIRSTDPGIGPLGEAVEFPRTVVPPLRDAPRKPGQSPADR
jgi:hypothetical protein